MANTPVESEVGAHLCRDGSVSPVALEALAVGPDRDGQRTSLPRRRERRRLRHMNERESFNAQVIAEFRANGGKIA